MIAELVLASMLAPPPRWAVAFCARFYFPPGDRRTSQFHIYLADLHGAHRRQISKGPGDAVQVFWTGRNSICWLEESEGTNRIMAASGPSWKPREVVRGRNLRYAGVAPSHPPRGKAGFEGLPGKYPQDEADPFLDENETIRLPGLPPIKYLGGSDAPPVRFESPEGWVEESVPDAFEIQGRKVLLPLLGTYRFLLPSHRPGHSWLYSESIAASAGSWVYLYDVDWRAGKATAILDDYSEIDFDPDSRYWAGIEAGRPLSPYGRNKRVWTNELTLGDLKTGRSWKVAKGLVHVISVSMRPGI